MPNLPQKAWCVPQLHELDQRWVPESFAQPAMDVAEQLLGSVLVRQIDSRLRRARIVEVEAYLGQRDLAAHASKGRTPRTSVLFGPAGIAYVYFVYGLHEMFNIVVGQEGSAESILVRAAEPLDDWQVDLTGPARFTRQLHIDRSLNGLALDQAGIWIGTDPAYQAEIFRTRRVGVDYARHWKNRKLRFIDRANPVAKRLKW